MEPEDLITYNGIVMRRDYAESLEQAQRLTCGPVPGATMGYVSVPKTIRGADA